jgi:hypothetical protein
MVVNTQTIGRQSHPDVASSEDGRYVVIWNDEIAEPDIQIKARLYDSSGNARGAELLINDPNSPTLLEATAVSADASGAFVVVWCAQAPSGAAENLQARRFDENGVARGAAFRVDEPGTTPTFAVDVVMAADGSFVVAWFDSTNIAWIRRYGADGAALAAPEPVSEGPVSFFGSPADIAIAQQAGGGWLLTWLEVINPEIPETTVSGRVIDAEGKPRGSELEISTDPVGNRRSPAVASLGNGRFINAWSSATGRSEANIHARRIEVSFGDLVPAGAALTLVSLGGAALYLAARRRRRR